MAKNDNIILDRLSAGIPGFVSRLWDSTIEQNIVGDTEIAYGMPVKMVNNALSPLESGDTKDSVYGILCRPFPTSSHATAFGEQSTAQPDIVVGVLRRGYMTVALTQGVASKGGAVYVRVTAAVDRPAGSFEAVPDGTNSFLLANATFMGDADEGGITELCYNI